MDIPKTIILILLFWVIGYTVQSQEVLTELQFNPSVKAGYQMSRISLLERVQNDTIPINLPFFDDFSQSDIFPSSSRWADKYGYVNVDFPVNPVNLGVVTLDAINDSGSMYPEALPGPQTFIADHLTSRYIRLDSIFTPTPKALNPSDSLFLSFYYQPQGRGSAPKKDDSLVLQFLLPAFDSINGTDTIHYPMRWRSVWGSKGEAIDSFFMANNRYFKEVMIPIKRADYFNKYFCFRFFNYVSLASPTEPSWQSNCSMWNIDQVYLNMNRSIFDTIQKEIRFIERPPSMLKHYLSMPYPQFANDPTREMADTVLLNVRNRDTITHKINYKYTVDFPSGGNIKTYQSNNLDIRPYPKFNDLTLKPPIPFIFPVSTGDSASFLMKHFIVDQSPGTLGSDTIVAEQKLFNYFAYDDGTAERGYGTTRTGSMIAYRFKLNKSPDTLRAISMFFNKTLSKGNEQYFLLTVWNDNGGKPGDTIYSRQEFPRFNDVINKFVTYHLEVPVVISGTFYIGVITTTDDNLNIGFDRYNNVQNNLLYNSTGQWNSSAYSGALMMRPLVGKPIPLSVEEVSEKQEKLLAYPNPCRDDRVSLRFSSSFESKLSQGEWHLTVRNLCGQIMMKDKFHQNINVSNIPSGFYIIDVANIILGESFSTKLVISK